MSGMWNESVADRLIKVDVMNKEKLRNDCRQLGYLSLV